MRRLVLALSGVVLLAVAAVAVIFGVSYHSSKSAPAAMPSGDAPPASSVLVDDDCANTGRYEPTTITFTCGDGTAAAQDLSWSRWGASEAVGHGTVNQVSCVPNCANGQDVSYRVQLTLSEPIKAASGTAYFTRITVTFLGSSPPGGSRTEMFKDCSDSPPAPYVPRCPADER
jgi:hypothetical protein